MDFIHDPENEQRIDEVYVFMSVDGEGRNGIVAAMLPGLGPTPMVTNSASIAEMLKGPARHIASLSGKRVVIARFARVGDDLWSTSN
jgi:hypothetical protein